MNNNPKLRYYDTFVTNPGSLDERIRRVTGLPSKEAMGKQMDTKPKRVAVDVLVPNHCSENCIDCYFQERGQHPDVNLNKQTIEGLQTMSEKLAGENGDIYYLYPREIATALSTLLSLSPNPHLLSRSHYSPPQANISRSKRVHRLTSVFSLNPRSALQTNPNIILVDDVCTTGSTLLSAASCFPPGTHLWGLTIAG